MTLLNFYFKSYLMLQFEMKLEQSNIHVSQLALSVFALISTLSKQMHKAWLKYIMSKSCQLFTK